MIDDQQGYVSFRLLYKVCQLSLIFLLEANEDMFFCLFVCFFISACLLGLSARFYKNDYGGCVLAQSMLHLLSVRIWINGRIQEIFSHFL